VNHHFGLSQSELRYNFHPDENDHFTNQARIRLQLERDNIEGDFLVQHAGVWGVTGGNQLTDPNLTIHRAALDWQPGDIWSLEVGRFELAYGGQRVLGSVGWSQTGRSWDGLRNRFEFDDELKVDLFGARYRDGRTVQASGFEGALLEDDAWLTGFWATAEEDLVSPLKTVDLYGLYDAQIDKIGAERADLVRSIFTAGSRVVAEPKPFDAVLTGAYQVGSSCQQASNSQNCTDTTNSAGGWFVDGEVGFSHTSPLDWRLALGASQASGDDPQTAEDEGYIQLYPTGHKWLGLTDIIGPRRNLREIRGTLSIDFGRVSLSERVHRFERLEPSTETVGYEFDTVLSATESEYLTGQLGYGLFAASDGMSQTDNEPRGVAHWGFVQAIAHF
jgi:hypothetical protein